MRKWTRLVLAVAALCCLPVFCLSPLLFGANPNCVQFARNDVCGYTGCVRTIYFCLMYTDETDCDAGKQTRLTTGMFTCVTLSGANTTCDVVLDGNGDPAYTDCVLKWACKWDPDNKECNVDVVNASCVAPYYKTSAPCK